MHLLESGAAQESNLPTVGLQRLAGFEDRTGSVLRDASRGVRALDRALHELSARRALRGSMESSAPGRQIWEQSPFSSPRRRRFSPIFESCRDRLKSRRRGNLQRYAVPEMAVSWPHSAVPWLQRQLLPTAGMEPSEDESAVRDRVIDGGDGAFAG
jgi:hypothetical protein